MDVKQLICRLNNFDTNAVVTVGDDGGGWSNIESVIEDGSCIKILMSDNVVFSDDTSSPKFPELVEVQTAFANQDHVASPTAHEYGAIEFAYDFIARKLRA